MLYLLRERERAVQKQMSGEYNWLSAMLGSTSLIIMVSDSPANNGGSGSVVLAVFCPVAMVFSATFLTSWKVLTCSGPLAAGGDQIEPNRPYRPYKPLQGLIRPCEASSGMSSKAL